jgi:aspartyl-tRNA(Asn)/glutamyl-tRNA(Gln) amidotransferase subunit B
VHSLRIIDAKGLRQISDVRTLKKSINEVMIANQRSVDECRTGRISDRASYKSEQGEGNPAQIKE